MLNSRIYTYKITFEEVPYYYYGVHKEKRYNEYYIGSPKTHKWCWELYTPKKQILEVFPYTDEGWLEAQEVEKRLIKPVYLTDKKCLNENCGGIFSMEALKKYAIGRDHQCGEKNSQYGKMWITNGVISISIPKAKVIPEGYRKGRVIVQKQTKYCVDCGVEICKKSKRCSQCSSIKNGKIKRKFEISKEELIDLIKQYPMTKVGEILGVSDNAVRKRCKVLGIN